MMSLRPRDYAIVAFILFVVFLSRTEIANAQNAGEPTIFDVRRSLPMEADEEVTKDFYINAGPEAGFKKGVYISVVRAVPIHDPFKNIQQATLNIPVGKLKVIDVQRGITVARLETELTDEERPTLEFEGVMVGDRIDVASITTEQPKKPKPKAKKKLATVAATVSPEAPAPGSAEAMAARSSGVATEASVAPAPAPAPAPFPAAVDTSKPVEMTTAAEVAAPAEAKTEIAPEVPSTTNTSAAPRPRPEIAPKKSQAPRSAANDDENTYPLAHAADTVRVADYGTDF